MPIQWGERQMRDLYKATKYSIGGSAKVSTEIAYCKIEGASWLDVRTVTGWCGFDF